MLSQPISHHCLSSSSCTVEQNFLLGVTLILSHVSLLVVTFPALWQGHGRSSLLTPRLQEVLVSAAGVEPLSSPAEPTRAQGLWGKVREQGVDTQGAQLIQGKRCDI